MEYLYFYSLLLLIQIGYISTKSVGLANKTLDRLGFDTCFPNLGCYEGMHLISTDEFPYSPEQINLQIKLYTRQFKDIPKVFLYTEAEKLTGSGFDYSKLTKFIVHGFGGSCDKPWLQSMKSAFLDKMDINLFCVDWKNGAVHLRYAKAAATTQLVGKMVAYFVKDIITRFGDIKERLHFIGFSLGAQVSGKVGSEVPGMARITGLDPAGPIFGSLDVGKKLDKTDALFVDVIHSNGDTLIKGGLGIFEASGHVDFYPNGGKNQPGCSNFIYANLQNVVNKIFRRSQVNRTCNHKRSVEIFTESIPETCVLNGFPCSSDWEGFKEGYCFDVSTALPIGINANMDPSRQGKFYLTTRAEFPLCGTQMKVTIDVDDPTGEQRHFKGTVKITFGERKTRLKETFTMLSGFDTPKVKSRVITVSQAVRQDILHLKYEQSGSFNIGHFDRSKLKVNSVKITNGITGETVIWSVKTTDNIIYSGVTNRLYRE